MHNPELMKYLKFDESELQVNRHGRLSEKQKARLVKQEDSQKGCTGILGIFLLLVALLGIAIAIGAIRSADPRYPTESYVFAGAFGCIWPLAWGSVGALLTSRLFAKMKVEVQKAEGPINIVKTIRRDYNSSTNTHSEHTVYELRVGGHTIEVGSGLPNYMMQGDVYAVYFAKFNLRDKKKELLSAELLTGNSAIAAQTATHNDDVEVVEYLKKGDLLGAIRMHRSIHGSDLEDAKGAVEEIKSRLGY